MVEPTNLKPRFARSLLIASDSAVRAGTSFMSFQRFCMGGRRRNPRRTCRSCRTPSARRERRCAFVNGGCDLQAVAHDAGVRQQRRRSWRRHRARHLARVEAVEGLAIVVALVQDGGPAQARLRAFENQELEEHPVIVYAARPTRGRDTRSWVRPQPSRSVAIGIWRHAATPSRWSAANSPAASIFSSTTPFQYSLLPRPLLRHRHSSSPLPCG